MSTISNDPTIRPGYNEIVEEIQTILSNPNSSSRLASNTSLPTSIPLVTEDFITNQLAGSEVNLSNATIDVKCFLQLQNRTNVVWVLNFAQLRIENSDERARLPEALKNLLIQLPAPPENSYMINGLFTLHAPPNRFTPITQQPDEI